ncbi:MULTISPECIES: hypothetical protein [unclassified Tatumella]|uniref:hypothetical protein n=1 Tax=unclassified Tatumella TaxID=2649542 RepID=UPI001BAFCF18|nr:MULTISPECIES: hypothetical protein [unclassified Tatumella]MBS0854959.1 hypothetical protein [Tatumella sp. JGM16]MBS0912079.1 hypothetical protein [Tatumella sp. JGM91]
MNREIFQQLFGSASVANAIISSSASTDDIGVVLRMHLVTESFLEAFICSAIGKSELFSVEPDDKITLKLNYHSKLGLAQKLGLPIPAYRALEKLNGMRNKLAHRIEQDFITDPILDSLKTQVSKIDTFATNAIEEEKAEYFYPDEGSKRSYSLTSEETPKRIKLMILVLALIRRATHVTVGNYE